MPRQLKGPEAAFYCGTPPPFIGPVPSCIFILRVIFTHLPRFTHHSIPFGGGIPRLMMQNFTQLSTLKTSKLSTSETGFFFFFLPPAYTRHVFGNVWYLGHYDIKTPIPTWSVFAGISWFQTRISFSLTSHSAPYVLPLNNLLLGGSPVHMVSNNFNMLLLSNLI